MMESESFWTEILGEASWENSKPELLVWADTELPDVGQERSVLYQGDWQRVYVSGMTTVLEGYDRVFICYFWPPKRQWVPLE